MESRPQEPCPYEISMSACGKRSALQHAQGLGQKNFSYGDHEISKAGRHGASAESRHFVFVHGACHGAWCWYKVVTLLQRNGHRATALDLASSGRDNTDPNTVSSLALLSKPVVEFFQALPDAEKVVLVAHSFGGFVATYIMERFASKLSAAVFLTALMLPSGSDAASETAVKVVSLLAEKCKRFPNVTPRTSIIPPKDFGLFYQLSPAEDVALANALVKPFPMLPLSELLTPHTRQHYGSVPRVFIKCSNDGMLTPDMIDLCIESNTPAQVIYLDSDHSPFFSATERLHSILLNIGATYA